MPSELVGVLQLLWEHQQVVSPVKFPVDVVAPRHSAALSVGLRLVKLLPAEAPLDALLLGVAVPLAVWSLEMV